MAAILSELTSKINITALKDRLSDVYSTVNDKVIQVKEALSTTSAEKKPEEKSEKKPEEKKEEPYADPPVPKTTKDKIFDFLIAQFNFLY